MNIHQSKHIIVLNILMYICADKMMATLTLTINIYKLINKKYTFDYIITNLMFYLYNLYMF